MFLGMTQADEASGGLGEDSVEKLPALVSGVTTDIHVV